MKYGAVEPGDVFYADLHHDGEIGIASEVVVEAEHARIKFVTQDGTVHIRRYPKRHLTGVMRKMVKRERNEMIAINVVLGD